MSTLVAYNKTSWIHAEDAILIESVLDNARSNKPTMEAYETASEKLKRAGFRRTSGACSQRWWQIKSKVINNPSLEVEEVVKMLDEPAPESSHLDKVIAGELGKEPKELAGIYFDTDVRNVLTLLLKKGGRGAQSKIVNEIVKAAFIEKGLL